MKSLGYRMSWVKVDIHSVIGLLGFPSHLSVERDDVDAADHFTQLCIIHRNIICECICDLTEKRTLALPTSEGVTQIRMCSSST